MWSDITDAWSAINYAELGVVLHFLVIAALTVRVLSVQRNTGVAVAWLAILFALPVVGVLAYILVGEPNLGSRYQRRNQQAQQLLDDLLHKEQLAFDQGQDLIPEDYLGVSRIGTSYTGFGIYDNNRMQLLTTPDAVFNELINDIKNAERIVLMEFYIVYPKGRVLEVFDALKEASARGVECHILADSVGSSSFFTSEEYKALEAAGVLMHQSLPVGLFKTLFKRTDLRNHRKIVVIDEVIGYTGSFNLVDPNFFKQDKQVGQWIDVMMRVVSHEPVSVVTAMSKVLITDIGAESKSNLDILHNRVNTYTRKLYNMKPTINDVNVKAAVLNSSNEHATALSMALPKLDTIDDVTAQLIPSAPQMTGHVIYNTLVTVIHRANRCVHITTPYFVPDEALVGALTTAAKRGVEVILIIPKKVDSFWCNMPRRRIIKSC